MPHDQMKSCIDACYACATACDHCAAACLRESDVKMLARCIQLDIDCAEMCRLAAGYMGRGSELAAAACESCAEECRRMAFMVSGAGRALGTARATGGAEQAWR